MGLGLDWLYPLPFVPTSIPRIWCGATVFAIGFASALWAIVTPNGFGHPLRHNWNWISNYTVVTESYVGLVVLALVVAALLSRSTTARERSWIAITVLLYLVAMRWTVFI